MSTARPVHLVDLCRFVLVVELAEYLAEIPELAEHHEGHVPVFFGQLLDELVQTSSILREEIVDLSSQFKKFLGLSKCGLSSQSKCWASISTIFAEILRSERCRSM